MDKPVSNERFVYSRTLPLKSWFVIRLGKNEEGHDIAWPFPPPAQDEYLIQVSSESEARKVARNLAMICDCAYEKGCK